MGGVRFKYFIAPPGFSSSDNFNRANGAINVGNPVWTNVAGDTMPVISANQLLIGPSIQDRALISTTPNGLTNVFSQLTYVIQALGLTSTAGPTIFNSGTHAAQNWYGAMGGNNGGGNDQLFITRCVAGVQTNLATGIVGGRVPGTIRIQAVVTAGQVSLSLIQNGITVLNAIDNTAQRLTSGLFGFQEGVGDGIRIQTFDNFICGSVGALRVPLYFNIGG